MVNKGNGGAVNTPAEGTETFDIFFNGFDEYMRKVKGYSVGPSREMILNWEIFKKTIVDEVRQKAPAVVVVAPRTKRKGRD